jgi:hypothetical protein
VPTVSIHDFSCAHAAFHNVAKESMNHVDHRFWYRVGIVAALTLIPLAGPVAVRAQTQPDIRVTLMSCLNGQSQQVIADLSGVRTWSAVPSS